MKLDKYFALFCGILLAVIAVTQVTLVALHHKAPTSTFGSADNVSLPNYPLSSSVWVGTGNTGDTVVVASSTGRQRLEITNISGATTTSQALYCNYGDRPSVLYSGLVVQASSTRTYTLDEIPHGAVRCRFPTASSTVTVNDW